MKGGAGGLNLLASTQNHSALQMSACQQQDMVLMPNTRFKVTTELGMLNLDGQRTCGLRELQQFDKK